LKRQRERENSPDSWGEKTDQLSKNAVKNIDATISNYQQPNAQLSQLSTNYQELSPDSFHQLSNYHHFPPSLEGGKLRVESEKRESDSELFPEDDPPSEPIDDMIARLKNRGGNA